MAVWVDLDSGTWGRDHRTLRVVDEHLLTTEDIERSGLTAEDIIRYAEQHGLSLRF